MSENLYSILENAIPQPGKILFTLPDGASVTYEEVFVLSGRLATLLTANGVSPGDRVAAQVPKSWRAIALYLAVLRCGAVYLPLNDQYTDAELSYFLSDAEAHTFVCSPARRATLAEVARAAGVSMLTTLGADGEGELEELASGTSEHFPAVARQADDLAAILYTSGTTGRSKGAMLTHGNLSSNAEVLVTSWAFSENDVLMHALPIFHIHGLFVAINTTMLAGAGMVLLPKFDALDIIWLIGSATVMMGVPTFYTRLLEHPELDRAAVRHMRLFTCGSAPLLAETLTAFERKTGHRILERYGMTETNMTISNPYEGERRAGTVGHPLPGCDVRIVNETTRSPVGTEEIGMIEVRGPGVFHGYWRQPEKTRAEFRADGFFMTGDLGKRDSDGYIHIVGRAKDLIITGGYNVYPKEIETELDQLEGVVESAVVGVPDADFGEAVVAVMVMEPGACLSVDEVRDLLGDRLSRYKLPKQVHLVEALPRNSMGKVQKAALRERFARA